MLIIKVNLLIAYRLKLDDDIRIKVYSIAQPCTAFLSLGKASLALLSLAQPRIFLLSLAQPCSALCNFLRLGTDLYSLLVTNSSEAPYCTYCTLLKWYALAWLEIISLGSK
jgi:hypothetical protein